MKSIVALRADRPRAAASRSPRCPVSGEHLVAELDQVAVEAIERAGSRPGNGCRTRPSRDPEPQEAVELLPIHRFRTLRGLSAGLRSRRLAARGLRGLRMVIGGPRVALTVRPRAASATPRECGSAAQAVRLDCARGDSDAVCDSDDRIGMLVAPLGLRAGRAPSPDGGRAGAGPSPPSRRPPVDSTRCSGCPATRGAPTRARPAALDRKRWEERFAAVRGELDDARAELAKSQARARGDGARRPRPGRWRRRARSRQPRTRR